MRIGGIIPVQTEVVQYQAKALLDGLAELGHDVQAVWADSRTTVGQIKQICSSVELMIIVSATRNSYGGMIPDGLPVVVWDQDDVVSHLAEPHRNDAYAFSLDAHKAAAMKRFDLPDSRCFHLMPGAERAFCAPPDPDTKKDIPVLFVGGCFPKRTESAMAGIDDEETIASLKAVLAINESWAPMSEVMAAIASHDFPSQMAKLAVLLAHNERRMRSVRNLANRYGSDLHLVGPRWDAVQFGDNSPTLHGQITDRWKLYDLHRRAEIVVYLHPLTYSHPRLFDACGAGCCVVMERNEFEVSPYMDNATIKFDPLTPDVIDFRLDMARESRDDYGQNAYDWTMGYHLMQHRAQAILNHVQGWI